MPESIPFELRIYCLCGQKMKVSSDMLGKPGKCIACRQKIRIPAENELGPDEVTVHLKDHPEYLRTPKRGLTEMPGSLEESCSDLDHDDVLLEGDSGQLAAVAFVRFETIRRLCNYEHKIKTQLQRIREGHAAELDKSTLMSYRGLARQSRQQLEDQIRESLIAIAAELQEIRTTLIEHQSALRVGDMEHVRYSKAVLPLRKRRENLVYRQQNLRGWLATEDPHVAGGLEDVALADVPVDLDPANFPLEEEISGLPIEHAVTQLERALRDRERADNAISELHHTSLIGKLSAVDLARQREDAEAERQRARTAVAFYRGRLEQVIQDCEEDSNALKTYEDVMRGNLKLAEVSPDALKKLEETIFRAQVDVKRARNMANRALNANAVSDVPNPHGTFLERLARPGGMRGLGVDSGFAWASSILLLIKLLLPVASQVPDGMAPAIGGNSVLLFVIAAIAGLTATIPVRLIRATLLNILWLVLTVGGAAYLATSFDRDTAQTFNTDLRLWLGSLDGALSLASWASLAVAAFFSFFGVEKVRWLALAVVLCGASVGAILLGGLFKTAKLAAPVFGEPMVRLNPTDGSYNVELTVENMGQQAFRLVDGDRGPDTMTFILEYRVGAQSWADAGPPLSTELSGRAAGLTGVGVEVTPGLRVGLHYRLSPGIYRAQLFPGFDGVMAVRKTFQLEAPDPALLALPAAEPVRPQPAAPEIVIPNAMQIELRGVLNGEGSGPIFSVIFHEVDGTERKAQFRLGDKIHGDWIISEFSPSHNTMTVVNGERLLIIERGVLETLN